MFSYQNTYFRSGTMFRVLSFSILVFFISCTNKLKDGAIGPKIHVSDFGAIGDGVADDTKAIQAALDAAWGSNVILEFAPDKIYKVSSSNRNILPRCLFISGYNTIEIKGNGSKLIMANGQKGDIIQVHDTQNITISDLDFDGNMKTATQYTIGLNIREDKGIIQKVNVKNVNIENCKGPGISIEAREGILENITISNCYNPSGKSAGLQIINFNNYNMMSRYVLNSVHVDQCHAGINITGGGLRNNALIEIEGNDISSVNNFLYYGLKTAADVTMRLRNSEFSGNKSSGIFVNYPATKIELSNCNIKKNNVGCDFQKKSYYKLDSLFLEENTGSSIVFGGITEAENIFVKNNGIGFLTSEDMEELRLKKFHAIGNKQGFLLQSGKVFISEGTFSGNRYLSKPTNPLFDLKKGLKEVTIEDVDFSGSKVSSLFGFYGEEIDLHLVNCIGIGNVMTRSIQNDRARSIIEDGRRRN